MTGTDSAQQHGGGLTVAISDAVVQLLHEYTGRGPTKARTTIDRDAIFVVLRDTMTKAERRLHEQGDGDLVLETRRRFQAGMRTDLVAAIEHLTARTVMAFMSTNHLDPDLACEVFVLEPEGRGLESIPVRASP